LADFLKSSPLKPLKSHLSFNSLGKSYLPFNRGEEFLEIKQSETRIVCGGNVC
jgi:hypothetical protein